MFMPLIFDVRSATMSSIDDWLTNLNSLAKIVTLFSVAGNQVLISNGHSSSIFPATQCSFKLLSCQNSGFEAIFFPRFRLGWFHEKYFLLPFAEPWSTSALKIFL